MGCVGPPSGGSWKKWSITHTESKPASSAAVAMATTPSKSAPRESPTMKFGIWSPRAHAARPSGAPGDFAREDHHRASAQPGQGHLALGGLERSERRQPGRRRLERVRHEEPRDGGEEDGDDVGWICREGSCRTSSSSGEGPPSSTTEGAQPITSNAGCPRAVRPVHEDYAACHGAARCRSVRRRGRASSPRRPRATRLELGQLRQVGGRPPVQRRRGSGHGERAPPAEELPGIDGQGLQGRRRARRQLLVHGGEPAMTVSSSPGSHGCRAGDRRWPRRRGPPIRRRRTCRAGAGRDGTRATPSRPRPRGGERGRVGVQLGADRLDEDVPLRALEHRRRSR